VAKADPSGLFWYKVGRRDTVTGLAKRFKISVRSIYKFNAPYVTRYRNRLVPGMCVWIWQPEKINGSRSPGFATGKCDGWNKYALARYDRHARHTGGHLARSRRRTSVLRSAWRALLASLLWAGSTLPRGR